MLASLCWFLAAATLAGFSDSLWLGAACYMVATAAARRATRKFAPPETLSRAQGGQLLLLLRGVAAGALVATVAAASSRLGAVWAGFFMTYPIAMTVISVTVHQRSGPDVAIAALRSMMFGIGSLAVFLVTLAATLPIVSPSWAFSLSLCAGVVFTAILALRSAQTRLAANQGG